MKKFLLSFLATLLVFPALAVEEPLFKFDTNGTFPNISSYTDIFLSNSEVGGTKWNVGAFSNNNNGWTNIRCGREKAESAATISNLAAIVSKVSRIEVKVVKVKDNTLPAKINLYISSENTFPENNREVISITPVVPTTEGVDWVFNIDNPIQYGYYKIEINMPAQGSTNKNGTIGVNSWTFYTEVPEVVTDPKDSGIAWPVDSFTAYLGSDNNFPTLENPNNLDVTYSSNNLEVAEIDANGAVSIKAAGIATIKATFAGNEDYNAKEVSYILTVSKGTVTLSFEQSEYQFSLGKDFEQPVLTTNPEGLDVTYSSTKPEVAYYDEAGQLKLVKAGETDITATFAGNDTYNSATATYHLTVLDPTAERQEIIYLPSYDWTPDLPAKKEDVDTELTNYSCSDPNLKIDLINVYYINKTTENKSFFLTKNTGCIVLKNIKGVVKSISLYSNSGASDKAVVDISYCTNKLGSIALNKKDLTTPFELSFTDYIENPEEIKIAATKDANVQISKIVVEVEVDNRPSPNFSFSTDECTVLTGHESEFTEPTLTYAENYDGVENITYSSSDSEVASVDAKTGKITFGDLLGTAIITAKAPATENFSAAEASYSLTVSAPQSLALIIKVNGEAIELIKSAEDENIYEAELNVEVGSTMTVSTNYGEKATITVLDGDDNQIEFTGDFHFDTPDYYIYQICAELEKEIVLANLYITVLNPVEILTHTVDFSKVPQNIGDAISSVKTRIVDITLGKGSNGCPAPIISGNDADKYLRFYWGDTMTITVPEGCLLEKIVFNTIPSGDKWFFDPSVTNGTFITKEGSTLVWVVDNNEKSNTLTVTNGGSSGNTPITSIDITFTETHAEALTEAALEHLVVPAGVTVAEDGTITNKQPVAISFVYLRGHNFHFKHEKEVEKPAESAPFRANSVGEGYEKFDETKPIVLDNKTTNFEFVTEHKGTGTVSAPVSIKANIVEVFTEIVEIMAEDPEAQIFNLKGERVTEPQEGQIYIVVRGNKSSKVAY